MILDKITNIKKIRGKVIKNTLQMLLRRGGLKFKLISFVFISIFIAISIQTTIIVPIMKSNIEKKAFEISTTTLERVSDFSSFPLLERTYENRLSLNDVIKKVKDSRIDGLVGISIYQREKSEDGVSFEYLAGFGDDVKGIKLDSEVLKSIEDSQSEKVLRDSYTLKKAKQREVKTYRFTKPITYIYQNKRVLLGVAVLYYDKQAVNDIIEEMLEYILTIMILILLLASLFIYFIGVRFTRPILEITKSATSVAEGDLNIKLDIKTNDEIENLADHFNAMAKSLKEKEKMQKFVSGSTMDMIQSHQAKDINLGGEYRKLTFLFSDIRGFTAMSEEKSPSEVISIVNFYLDLQSQIIKENGGDIDKFIGDEIMASFRGEDATNKALKCALAIQESISKENLKRSKEDETVCEVGIGINEGEVIVGNIGFSEHMDFTAVGQAVNVASKLCSVAKAGTIVIDKHTYDTANCSYDVKIQTPILIKGMRNPIDTYVI